MTLTIGTLLRAYVNNVEPDQTAPKEQSDQDLHCLPFCQLFFGLEEN